MENFDAAAIFPTLKRISAIVQSQFSPQIRVVTIPLVAME